jgi:murein DD-endopeptidase MepM/ murein hydrolase activator NlpD
MISLSLSNRAKVILASLSIVITTIVSGQYIYYNKFNAYQVYMNGKPLAYVKNKEDFYNVEKNIEKDLEKRFGKVTLKDDITFKEVSIKSENIADSSTIKNSIIKNSRTSIPTVLMKSDGREVGVLANESEMIKVLDIIKNEYKEKDKDGTFKLNNRITYVKQDTNIKDTSTIEDAIKIIKENPSNPLICFSKEKEANGVQNVSLSRSSSVTSFVSFPSKGTITSPFGMRWGKMHNGIDIGAPMGDPIHAAMDGKVVYAKWEDGYGKVIKIDHGVGVQTVYGHCSNIDVNEGQQVKKGENIGKVGSTGNSTGPHVHFEVRVDGAPQDPIKYLK